MAHKKTPYNFRLKKLIRASAIHPRLTSSSEYLNSLFNFDLTSQNPFHFPLVFPIFSTPDLLEAEQQSSMPVSLLSERPLGSHTRWAVNVRGWPVHVARRTCPAGGKNRTTSKGAVRPRTLLFPRLARETKNELRWSAINDMLSFQ